MLASIPDGGEWVASRRGLITPWGSPRVLSLHSLVEYHWQSGSSAVVKSLMFLPVIELRFLEDPGRARRCTELSRNHLYLI
jgi:hypothetical protein